MKPSELAARLEVGVQRLPQDIERIVQTAADAAISRMHGHFTFWQWWGSWNSRPLGKLFHRSGTLEASLQAVVASAPGQVTATFSMEGEGAPTQEYGATIHPQIAKMLTIKHDSSASPPFYPTSLWRRKHAVHVPARPVVMPEVSVAAEQIATQVGGLIVDMFTRNP